MFRSFLSKSLIGTCSPLTAPLQGLRVLCSFFIILGHNYVFSALILDSPFDMEPLMTTQGYLRKLLYQTIITATYLAVDVFLFISGFLFASTLYSRTLKDSGKLSLSTSFQYLVSRWLRLFPIHALMFLINKTSGAPRCENLSELTLLKSSNLDSLCVVMGWSTLVDFQAQLFVIMLCLCLPSLNLAENLMWMLTFANGLFRVQKWYDSNFPFYPVYITMMDFMNSREEAIGITKSLGMPITQFDPTLPHNTARRLLYKQHVPLYYFAEYRVAALFIGAAVWFSMKHRTTFTCIVRSYPLISMLSAGAIVIFCGFGLFDVYQNLFLHTIQKGFGRILFCIAVGIFTVLTCSVDKADILPSRWWLDSIRRYFGWRLFVILARYTYAMYLIQYITAFIISTDYPKITMENFEPFRVALGGIKWYSFTLLMAVPFCIYEQVGLILRKEVLKFLFRPKDWMKSC